jgi:hypothetical protein
MTGKITEKATELLAKIQKASRGPGGIAEEAGCHAELQ